MRRAWLAAALALLVVPSAMAANSTCENLHLIPSLDQCSFVLESCQDHQLGYLNYFKMYYCHSSFVKLLSLMFTFSLLSILFISLGLTSSEFLCPNLSTISYYLQIPDNLSGLTLLAFGNGSPDILGTYTSFMSDNGSLAIGELIGSAFLITSLVIGAMSVIHPFKIYSDETHKQDKLIFLRDAFFFILSTILVICFLADGKLEMWECLVMILLYISYVAVIIGWNWIVTLSNEQIRLDARIRNIYNFDEEFVINDVEEANEDKLENISTLMRPSLFDALEFQSLVQHLSKKASIPAINGLSVISDEHQMNLIRQSLNRPSTSPHANDYYEDGEEDQRPSTAPANLDSTDYELRSSNAEQETTRSGLKKFLTKRYHLDLAKDELIQLFPLLDDFKSKSFVKKLFLVFCLPVYILLKLTIIVRQNDDFDSSQTPKFELNLLLVQTTLAPLLVAISSLGSDSSLFIILPIVFAVAGALPFFTYTVLLKSTNQKMRNLVNLSLSLIGFVTSISWISIIATELISILKFLSNLFGLSDAIMGLTVFAMGNSVGDFISNFTIARMGFPLMALAACFGGPLLNLLLGIGLNGVFVLEAKNLEYFSIEIDSSLIISSVLLLINLLFLIVVVPYNNWIFDRWVGMTMMALWCVGTAINILIAAF